VHGSHRQWVGSVSGGWQASERVVEGGERGGGGYAYLHCIFLASLGSFYEISSGVFASSWWPWRWGVIPQTWQWWCSH